MLDDTLGRSAPELNTPPSRGFGVRLAGVRKSFGQRSVIHDLDLDVDGGSFMAIVGRSGEGKSTLLRLLAGLETPDAGSVTLDGRPVTGTDPAVTMMFQDPRLLPWQRVLQNVAINRGRDWRRRGADALAAVGLPDRARDWPAALSGGQRQRVALARALMGQPRLLLLDEPFGALDALTRIEMHRLVLGLWTSAGFTSVIVTHDVGEAVALADRVIVLRQGGVARDMPIPRQPTRTAAETFELQAEILRTLGVPVEQGVA